ncbi:MAG: thioredoxin family protein [Candidatus Micrarchaeota archaeon]|nr:thioredoxin family protein [Candidatus Micrarchaeota archaeon]
MILCVVAMVIFGVLGIFSAKYRELAKEAFSCVFKTIQLKPCDTKLDQRIKSKLIAKLMKYSPWLAKLTYKNFYILSWIFTLLFFGSMAYTAYSLYNLAVYGSCSPGSFCIFNPNANVTKDNNVCNITGKFIEFYGEECPHCRKMIPVVAQVENETGVHFDKLEIWHNDTNKNIYLVYSEYINRDCGSLGIPTFVALKTNNSMCGEKSTDELKTFIMQNG